MAVNVARVEAPNVAAIATTAKAPAETWAPGISWFSPAPTSVPAGTLMSRIGAEGVPPEVPEPKREPPGDEFDRTEHGDGFQREAAVEHVVDGVVADPEGTWLDEPDAGDAADAGCQNSLTGEPPVQRLPP